MGYTKRYRPEILMKVEDFVTDENLRALVALCALRPVTNSKGTAKGKGKGKLTKTMSSRVDNNEAQICIAPVSTAEIPNSNLIMILPEGTNVTSIAAERRHMTKKNIQLYLMFVKGQEETSYFIQGDRWFLTPPLSSPVSAFDLLFKVYYVFNLQFPTSLINLFNFFANYVYGIDSVFTNSVSSLHIHINNFKNMSSEPSTSNAEWKS